LFCSLSLAGIDTPKDRVIDGLNVTDVFLGSGLSPHDYMYFWNGKQPGKDGKESVSKKETV
jgi:hypothetical protein